VPIAFELGSGGKSDETIVFHKRWYKEAR
jgi:hypothetical protein